MRWDGMAGGRGEGGGGRSVMDGGFSLIVVDGVRES